MTGALVIGVISVALFLAWGLGYLVLRHVLRLTRHSAEAALVVGMLIAGAILFAAGIPTVDDIASRLWAFGGEVMPHPLADVLRYVLFGLR